MFLIKFILAFNFFNWWCDSFSLFMILILFNVNVMCGVLGVYNFLYVLYFNFVLLNIIVLFLNVMFVFSFISNFA